MIWEFFQNCIALYNLPYTVFMGILLAYWLLVIIGALDVEVLDGAVESSENLEGIDAADGGTEINIPPTAITNLLDFVYFRKIPLVVLASLFIFPGWMSNLILNNAFNPTGSTLLGLSFYLPSSLLGIFAIKLFGKPLAKFFKILNEDADALQSITGNVCTLITSANAGDHGIAVIDTGSAEIRVNVIPQGALEFKKGDKALIYTHDKEKDLYVIDKIEEEI